MRHARAIGVVCAFAAFAIMVLPSPARASASDSAAAPAFDLDYSAPVACAREETFVAAVRERTEHMAARHEHTSERRRFRVRIADEQGGYLGALETFSPPSTREVHGASCEEVVRALVVFLSLAVSPADGEEASEDAPVLGSPLEERQAALAAPSIPPAPETIGTAAPAAPLPHDPTRDQPAAANAQPPRESSRFGVDVRALAVAGLAPALAPGGAISARIVLAERPRLRWLLHVGGVAAYREASVLDRGAFTFFWSTARIDVGPALDLGRFRLAAGPMLHAGLLMVGARALPSAVDYSGFWGDAGGFLRLDRALSPSVGLSAMVELAVPMQRKAFGLQGVEEPVHEIPRLVGVVSFGITLGR